MSRAIFEAPTTFPREFRIGEMVSEMSTNVPSLRCRIVSKCSMRSPRLIFSRMSGSSSRRSTGMMIVIGLPTASSAVKPKSRCALAFQLRITPLRSFDRMASSDDSMMAR